MLAPCAVFALGGWTKLPWLHKIQHMANGAALTLGPVRLVARWSLRSADHAGRFTFLLVDMLRGLAEWRIYLPRTFEQSLAVGYGSLFIVLLVAGFAGAVTSLQTGYQFTGALPLYYAGAVISESMILELGPVLTALILAGRIGARYAAELGTMRVTEQIDALTTIPCYLGFNTQQGAEGVGRATTQAVVSASVAILMLDAVITKLLLVAK